MAITPVSTFYWTDFFADIYKVIPPAASVLLETVPDPNVFAIDELILLNNKLIYGTIQNAPGEVRQYDLGTGVDSIISSGSFGSFVEDIVLDPGGATIIVADTNNHQWTRVNLTTGAVTVLVTLAANRTPQGLAYDALGNLFGVAAEGVLYQIHPTTGAILRTLNVPNVHVLDGLCYDSGTNLLYCSGAQQSPNQACLFIFDPTAFTLLRTPTSTILKSLDSCISGGDGKIYMSDISGGAGNAGSITSYDTSLNSFAIVANVSGINGLTLLPGSNTPTTFEISLFGVKRKYHPEDKEPCAELPEPEIVKCAV